MLLTRKLVAEHPHGRGDHRQRDGEPDVGVDDRPRFTAVRYWSSAAPESCDAVTAARPPRISAEPIGGKMVVPRLLKAWAKVRRLCTVFGRAEQADERVGHDLDDDHAARQHEQGEQEQTVGRGRARLG